MNAVADPDDLPEVVRYALENAVEIARAPRVPRTHLRPGLVPETKTKPVQCDYTWCREVATEVLWTRTVRRDYCRKHFERVLADVRARKPRRLNINAFKEGSK